jgi:hypothetical protein
VYEAAHQGLFPAGTRHLRDRVVIVVWGLATPENGEGGPLHQDQLKNNVRVVVSATTDGTSRCIQWFLSGQLLPSLVSCTPLRLIFPPLTPRAFRKCIRNLAAVMAVTTSAWALARKARIGTCRSSRQPHPRQVGHSSNHCLRAAFSPLCLLQATWPRQSA